MYVNKRKSLSYLEYSSINVSFTASLSISLDVKCSNTVNLLLTKNSGLTNVGLFWASNKQYKAASGL